MEMEPYALISGVYWISSIKLLSSFYTILLLYTKKLGLVYLTSGHHDLLCDCYCYELLLTQFFFIKNDLQNVDHLWDDTAALGDITNTLRKRKDRDDDTDRDIAGTSSKEIARRSADRTAEICAKLLKPFNVI